MTKINYLDYNIEMHKLISNIEEKIKNKNTVLEAFEEVRYIFHKNNLLIDNHIGLVRIILRSVGFDNQNIDSLELEII